MFRKLVRIATLDEILEFSKFRRGTKEDLRASRELLIRKGFRIGKLEHYFLHYKDERMVVPGEGYGWSKGYHSQIVPSQDPDAFSSPGISNEKIVIADLRSGAKVYKHSYLSDHLVLTSPARYDAVAQIFENSGCDVTLLERYR